MKKYELLIKEGKKLLEEDKITDSIEKFLEAKKLKNTEEVNKLLDAAYFERGEYFYNIGNFEKAKEDLEKVKYDSDLVNKAAIILDKITKQEQERDERIKKNIIEEHDEFKKITIYVHVLEKKNIINKMFSIFPFIGKSKTEKWFILRLMLYRSFNSYRSWLFVNEIIALVNDKSYDIPSYTLTRSFVDRGLLNNGYYERINFPCTEQKVVEFVRAIVDEPLGTKIKFRIYGSKGYIDYTLTKEEHLAWKDIMYFYDKINLPTYNIKGSKI